MTDDGTPGGHRWLAVSPPGLEGPLLDEVRGLPGAGNPVRRTGGVELEGGIEVGFRANLSLRIASRVLGRIGTVDARDRADLRRGLAEVPWERYLRSEPAEIRAAAHRCRLRHSGLLVDEVRAAIAGRIEGRDGEAGPGPEVLVRGARDRFTVSVDASGELLHKRGYRQETSSAPLRETLAAGLLALCGWEPSQPLVDPMCGSGTIVLEAASIALGRAPGRDRSFALESWPCFDDAVAVRLREEARATEQSALPAPVLGLDRSGGAVGVSRRNAERAGLDEMVVIERCPIADLGTLPPGRLPEGPGLVILNPPYGKRAGSDRELVDFYREIGRMLRERFPGWQAAVLVPERRLAEALRLDPIAEHPLRNGGIRVRLVRARL